MTCTKKAFLTLAFVTLALPIGGCESVDSAMLDIKERVAAIRMPSIKPSQDTFIRGEDDEVPPPAFAPAMREAPPAAAGSIPEAQNVDVVADSDCPKISVIEDLDSLHQFTNPDRPTPESRVSSIVLKNLETGCTYNENNVVVHLDLTFEGQLGPRARVWQTDKPSFAYPYFVAITTPNGNISAKEVFAATITYDKESDTTIHHQTIRQIIPLSGDFESDYEILIGFQLTEGELAYNRSLREGPVTAAGVSEQYIKSRDPAPAQAQAKPMTVIPEQKPPVPEKAPAPAPKPEQAQAQAPAPMPAPEPAPAPAPVAQPAPAHEPQPAPVTATEEPAVAPAPQSVTITEDIDVIVVEEPAEEPVAPEPEEVEEGESAILEENAIIDAETTVDPVQRDEPGSAIDITE